jgi:hypothetical protein
MHQERSSPSVALLVLLALATAGVMWAGTAVLADRPGPAPARRTVVRAGDWSVSFPTATQAPSTPWVPGPDPDSPDPDGNGVDTRGCPYPNPFPDIVSDQDYAIARAAPDPRVLRCSLDRRPPVTSPGPVDSY